MDFVVGQPRSGTTFLVHLLNWTGEVVCVHQNLLTLSCYQSQRVGSAFYEGRCSADEGSRRGAGRGA